MDDLTPDLRERVRRDFAPADRKEAERLLRSYAPDDDDPEGAARVRRAMLMGAAGDLGELKILRDAARTDHRDVLYWTGG